MREYYLVTKTDTLFLDLCNSPISLHSSYEAAKQKISVMNKNDEKNNVTHNEYKIHPMELIEELNEFQIQLNLL